MAFSRGPAFCIVTINLSTAGSQTFNQTCGSLTFVDARDANGVLALGAVVNIQLGDASGEAIPASINTLIRLADPVQAVVFSWTSQPGITARFMLARDNQVVIHSPPAEQIVTQSMGATLTAAAVSITTAAQIAAAGSRQKLTVFNNSAADTLYLGKDGTVTAATGFPLGPKSGFTFEGTTAAVYGVSGGGAVDVRTLLEA